METTKAVPPNMDDKTAGSKTEESREIDALRWRFETMFRLGFVILVSAILSATLMPSGSWTIYKGTALKFPALANFIAHRLPPFSDLGFRLRLFAIVSYACGEFAIIYLRLNCKFYGGDALSDAHRKLFFRAAVSISPVVCVSSMFLIAGEEVTFGVYLLCFMSIVSVAAFKLAANKFSSAAVAMLVLAQCLGVVVYLANRGGFYLQSSLAVLPILTALYSLRIPVDNIYNRLLETPYKVEEKEEDKHGYRAKDTSIEEAVCRVLFYFGVLAISVYLF